MSATTQAIYAARQAPRYIQETWLFCLVLLFLGLGLVMVLSTSVAIAERQFGSPYHFLESQCQALFISGIVAMVVIRVPIVVWQHLHVPLLCFGIILLVLVLVPGFGHEVNGSLRWLTIGPFVLQPSEVVKFFVVTYIAGYLVRHQITLRQNFSGFISPIVVLLLLTVLLLLEPDFGTSVILFTTTLGMLFLAGAPFLRFCAWVLVAMLALFNLIISSPYRFERLTSFMDPWGDPFASGFQLTQALIAFARGDIWGVGLGAGVQKLFYLPEAHTDFVFAVLVEELGLIFGIAVVVAYAGIVWRAFVIGRIAEQSKRWFAAYLAYGIGLLIGLQAYFNIGVNMGVLPTKGLTLPLLSYGGSSLLVNCVMLAVLFRIALENRYPMIDRVL